MAAGMRKLLVFIYLFILAHVITRQCASVFKFRFALTCQPFTFLLMKFEYAIQTF